MSYQYEATTDFFSSITEVDTLIELAEQDNSNRSLFLKLAVVSLVTKFQVFVETILEEFRYRLNNKPSRALSTYLLMNSLRLSLSENNALIGITKHHNYSDDKKDKIISYVRVRRKSPLRGQQKTPILVQQKKPLPESFQILYTEQ